MTIGVSIVEDEAAIRQSLATLIDQSKGFRCLSHYGNAEEALRRLPQDRPEVVLMDINLPGRSGIHCARQLKALLPETQILMLTVYEDSDLIFQSLVAGASGYLLKRTPHAKLLEAIQDVVRGASPMSGSIARKVVQYFQQRGAGAGSLAALTAREHQILDCLAQGLLYKEIAERLGISLDTVRGHLRSTYDKLHVHSRTEAVVKYLGREIKAG